MYMCEYLGRPGYYTPILHSLVSNGEMFSGKSPLNYIYK